MRNSLLILIFSMICFMACQKSQTLSIEEDKLVNVLADIHIAESTMINVDET